MAGLKTKNLLEFDAVHYQHPGSEEGLRGCSLVIREGTRNAILGLNGAGKSTLLWHANGLLRPRSGVVRYAGTALDYRAATLRALRRETGLVFQNPEQQIFSASVEEDVAFGPLNSGLDVDSVRSRVAQALAEVGMSAHAKLPVHQLSFGQKKRVAIAGVLAMRPRLLVLDEPFAGLDEPMQLNFAALLDQLHANGMTIVLSTHDLSRAWGWADNLHLMVQGQCRASFAAEELPAYEEMLLATGFALPPVLALTRKLLAAGVLPAQSAPRTMADLLALLEQPAPEG